MIEWPTIHQFVDLHKSMSVNCMMTLIGMHQEFYCVIKQKDISGLLIHFHHTEYYLHFLIFLYRCGNCIHMVVNSVTNSYMMLRSFQR